MGLYHRLAPSSSALNGRVNQIPINPLVRTSKAEQREEFGEKVFFMKARIMAGQADVSSDTSRYQEFRWLTKEEIETVVAADYWRSAKNMLVAR